MSESFAMHKTLLLPLIALVLLASCRSASKNHAKFLNRDSLPAQLATIDNTRDTTITTLNGARIHFAKGSFSAPRVRIKVKEAYSLEQMILAGLFTESGGKPLSSGGMIYISAADPGIEMIKPVAVSIPTNFYDDRMKLYKGEEKDGRIDWTDPRPLSDSTPKAVARGRTIFEKNCGNCHGLDKDQTGPALLGVRDRVPWCDYERLVQFTRNAPRYMNSSNYTLELLKKYGQVMTSFTNLSRSDVDAIYTYIGNEELKRGMVRANNEFSQACVDSCRIYDSLYNGLGGETRELIQQRDSLLGSKEARINFDRTVPARPMTNEDNVVVSASQDLDIVQPEIFNSIYYSFDIQSPGWYNIDYQPLPDAEQSVLKLSIPGNYGNGLNVFIAVPSSRIFSEGGPIQGEAGMYAFYQANGKVSIRPGTRVTVFAVGEEAGKIVFDARTFICAKSQTITLKPVAVTKEDFNKAVRSFDFEGVSIDARDSRKAEQLRIKDKEIVDRQELIERYRPKKCACHCWPVDSAPAKDSMAETSSSFEQR